MAATRLIALHVNKGKSAAASIRDRLDYTLNPDKTQKGEFISAYECDPYLAWREFSLAREMYLQQNVRAFEKDVIARQSHQAVQQNGYRYERTGIANTEESYQKTGHHSEKKRCGEKELPFSLLVDIEAKIREGKGIGYEKWAKTFNLQQSAKALLYLQESGIDSWEKLYKKETEANDRFYELQEEIRIREARLKELGSLKKSIVEYSKTRTVYEAYRKAGYSEKFFETHRAEITIHRAAKKNFDNYKKTHPEIRKLPTVKEITAEYGTVLEEKKELYQQYKTAKEEMQKINIARRNVETLLGEKIENQVPEKEPSKKERSHRGEAR